MKPNRILALATVLLLLSGCFQPAAQPPPESPPPSPSVEVPPVQASVRGAWMLLDADYFQVGPTEAEAALLRRIPETYEGKTYMEWWDECYEPGDVSYLSWGDGFCPSPDGRHVAYSASKGSVTRDRFGTSVFLLDLDSNQERVLLYSEDYDHRAPIRWLDGETLLCAVYADGRASYALCKLSGEVTPLTIAEQGDWLIAEARDNSIVYYEVQNGSADVRRFHVATIDGAGQVTPYCSHDAGFHYLMHEYALGQDGKTLAFTQRADLGTAEREMLLLHLEDDTVSPLPDPEIAGADWVDAIDLWWEGDCLRGIFSVGNAAGDHFELWQYVWEGAEAPPAPPPTPAAIAKAYLADLFGHDVLMTRLAFASRHPIYEMSLEAYAIQFGFAEAGVTAAADYLRADCYFFFWVAPGGAMSAAGIDFLDGRTPEAAALELGWGLDGVECAVSRDGYPGYYGLGGTGLGLAENNMGAVADEALPDWEPLQQEGDAYGRVTMDGLEYIYYVYDAAIGSPDAPQYTRAMRWLTTTRTDVATYRGARVGMTRAEIRARYPEASGESLWPYEGDYLWYRDARAVNNLLFFHFAEDRVTSIELLTEPRPGEDFAPPGHADDAELILGDSVRFGRDELEAAAASMKEAFFELEGCYLRWVKYDETFADEQYRSRGHDLAPGAARENVVIFSAYFDVTHYSHTSVYESGGGWTWTLVRDNRDAPWRVADRGY